MSVPAAEASAPTTIRDELIAHRQRTNPALRTVERSWSWAELLDESSRRARALAGLLDPERPPHVGLLADNTVEMVLQLGAAGLGGHVVVGLNSTRRGEALLADIRRADCQVLVVDPAYAPLLAGLDLSGLTVLDPTTHDWGAETDLPDAVPSPEDLFMLIFTSGTSGNPKAVRVTHLKVTQPGHYIVGKLGLHADDVLYCSMPLFHSNGVMASWGLGVVTGATLALPSGARFSASGFLDDVRRLGATYANYVGKPLSYVLAVPERPDDHDNPLRMVFGNEAGEREVRRFSKRFDTVVIDGFGSSENAVVITRTPDTPPGALGLPLEGIKILDPQTGRECPSATRDETGRVTNLDECVGEMVNTSGGGQFAGYYNDPDATAERMRGGMYWSGDLAYRDEDGYFWFAGRTADWMRVDGENLAAAPIEALLLRHPDIVAAAVYALPDDVGDLLVAALVLTPDATLDPDGFGEFLAAQPDLSPQAWPRMVRILDELPRTATNKVVKRELRADGTGAGGVLWVRGERDRTYAG